MGLVNVCFVPVVLRGWCGINMTAVLTRFFPPFRASNGIASCHIAQEEEEASRYAILQVATEFKCAVRSPIVNIISTALAHFNGLIHKTIICDRITTERIMHFPSNQFQ